ncbi:hypothetical protein Ddc_10503 [Ditylenchus destructor]|nr:hypothetical protein Ddc_10503 [Ditylenchus destructor]
MGSSFSNHLDKNTSKNPNPEEQPMPIAHSSVECKCDGPYPGPINCYCRCTECRERKKQAFIHLGGIVNSSYMS